MICRRGNGVGLFSSSRYRFTDYVFSNACARSSLSAQSLQCVDLILNARVDVIEGSDVLDIFFADVLNIRLEKRHVGLEELYSGVRIFHAMCEE